MVVQHGLHVFQNGSQISVFDITHKGVQPYRRLVHLFAVHMGYFGADIVLDKNKGHMLLELNARPGLAIQIANGEGLAARLEYLDANMPRRKLSAEERIAFSLKAFP